MLQKEKPALGGLGTGEKMEENYFMRGLGVALATLLGGVISATAIWSVRRFFPRKAAYWLTTPVGALIRRLVGRERPAPHPPSQPALEVLDRIPQRPADRD